MKKNQKKLPTVSVIIPVHNAGEFLLQAIDSILRQTFSDFELITVNDGSTDNSLEILQKLAKHDKRIKIISYEKNKGESAAGNLGYRISLGKYIARMDADDIAHPRRLQKQVDFLEQHSDYIVVGTQAEIIDEHDNSIGQKLFPTSHEEIYQEYGIMHPMLHPSLMFRRSLVPWKYKLWANKAEPNDDYFTLFTFLSMGKFANLPDKLMSYRMHSNNKSMQNIKRKFVNSLRIRFYAVRHLDYKITSKMLLSTAAQSIIVLSLPEWITVGTYFWFRKMKSFDQAFPPIYNLKNFANKVSASRLKFEYILPPFFHSFFFRNNS